MGHKVTAFTRDASKLAAAPRFIIVQGDAMQPADVARAVPGHDAAVVSLGNSQNPFALLLGARRTTPPNICEVGTRNIIAAIDPTSPARLIVVTAFHEQAGPAVLGLGVLGEALDVSHERGVAPHAISRKAHGLPGRAADR